MTNPPPGAQDILKVLDRHLQLGTVRRENPATFLGYKEVLDELHWTKNTDETWGDALERQGLAELAFWTRDENHPAVTGLIIDKTKLKPGPGYFKVYSRDPNDKGWWLDQVQASIGYPWRRFLTASDPIPPDETPQAEDIGEPPERIQTITYRILRDTDLGRRIKELHGWKCQLCKVRIELPNGYYAEGHHIQPLGKPHDGPDVMSNILCVCPNCHARLDYGTIKLDAGKISTVAHHVVDQCFIDYHNGKVYRGE